MLVVVATTAGTGDAFVVPPTRAEYGQCRVDRSTQHNNLYVGGASRRVRSPRSESSLFARSKISDEEMEQRKDQLRILLCATKAEIDQLVRYCPNVLNLRDVAKGHGPKVAMLQKRLGIDQKVAGKLCLNGSRLLTCTVQNLESKIDWLQERLNLNKTQLRKIMERVPGTLACSIEGYIQPSLENIQTHLELNDKELTKMIARTPDLLNHKFSTEELAARLSFLQNLLNIEENDLATLRKAIIKRPDILFYPKDRMIEIQQWISERLGLSDSKIAQMSTSTPQVLTAKISTLGEKVDWVQTALSLRDDDLCELFGKFSPLFGYCPKKNLEPKLQFLRMTFELSDDALKELLLRMPGLFSSSEGTIEKKYRFYTRLIGESAAKKLVVERPYLIVNFSLENRLKPRLEEVRKSGEKVKWDETTINRLATRSDALWENYGLNKFKK